MASAKDGVDKRPAFRGMLVGMLINLPPLKPPYRTIREKKMGIVVMVNGATTLEEAVARFEAYTRDSVAARRGTVAYQYIHQHRAMEQVTNDPDLNMIIDDRQPTPGLTYVFSDNTSVFAQNSKMNYYQDEVEQPIEGNTRYVGIMRKKAWREN